MTAISAALPDPTDQVLNGVAALPHLGVIRAQGEEAAKFLHGQLTQDFALLGTSEVRLAALCTAKGRMQASFIGFKRSETEILLVISLDLLPATLKRLSMFVLRAKVKLTDATSDFSLFGLLGDAARAAVDTALPPWRRVESGDASIVTLYPADGQPRALWVAPVASPAPAGDTVDMELWLWSEVRSGVAMLTAPVAEAFVPQMLNYESVGGVNFKKGCYPGQEVVARSQFRGTLKRRAYLAHADAPLAAGQEVFEAGADAAQPSGTVVQSAAAPGGGFDAIVSMQVSAAQASGLLAGAAGVTAGPAQGPALELLPLPYELLDDV